MESILETSFFLCKPVEGPLQHLMSLTFCEKNKMYWLNICIVCKDAAPRMLGSCLEVQLLVVQNESSKSR